MIYIISIYMVMSLMHQLNSLCAVQGDLIAENGTMSGGGGNVRTGKMCLGNAAPQTASDREVRAELERLEATLAQLEGQLQVCGSEYEAVNKTSV